MQVIHEHTHIQRKTSFFPCYFNLTTSQSQGIWRIAHKMSFFGGKDPFDHPFFTQPFGGLFGGTHPFVDPFFTSNFGNNSGPRKQISIEELNPDDDGISDAKSLPKQNLSVKNSDESPSGI